MTSNNQNEPENAHDLEAIMDSFHSRLQEEGFKSTRQRDAIVETFFVVDKHLTADELLTEVRKEQPRMGYATVYRTLKLLVDLGFAVAKDFGDGQTRYDPIHDQDPDHDHIICVQCRKIIEFNDPDLIGYLAQISESYGVELQRRQLQLYGVCKEHRNEIDPRKNPYGYYSQLGKTTKFGDGPKDPS